MKSIALNTLLPESCYYVVTRIFDGQVVYDGKCLGLAAEALYPGTCYGKAPDLKTAMINCSSWRQLFLERKERTDGNSVGCD